MTALAGAQNLLQRLAEAIPAAWRQDRVFRGAAVGAGITGVLLLLRLLGPHAPALQSPNPSLVPAVVPYVSALGAGAPSPAQPPPVELPKIAPGHPLGDVTVVLTPGGDRFGTFKSGRHP